jgi:aldehyde:ferredoxin oxidoreductase
MTVLPGYAGRLLRVDLTAGRCWAEDLDPALVNHYPGGAALGARLLYAEAPARGSWSAPDNPVILATGPLAGTRVMGGGNFTVVTRGALTGGATSTQANGYLGAFLKFSGFDAIVIRGRAARLSFLYVHDGQAELRDAAFLDGKDTWETEDLIKQELKVSPPGAMSVFSIGPAGEKMVAFAALVGDRGHVAAHNGVGAVLGAKNLKAVAVARSTGKVGVADPDGLAEASRRMFEAIKADPQWSNNYHTGTLWIMGRSGPGGRVPVRNYTTNVLPFDAAQLATFGPDWLRAHLEITRPHPCWACLFHHCQQIKLPEGPLAGRDGEEPEYEGYAGMGPQVGILSSLTATALANEVDRLGLCVNEAGWVVGLVMELYEKGQLRAADLGGIEARWGDPAAVRGLLGLITRREGLGDILAEGARGAAARLGGMAPEAAIYGGAGNTPMSHDHRRAWNLMISTAFSSTGTTEIHLQPRGAAVGLAEPADPFAGAETARWVARTAGVTAYIDSLGACRQCNREIPEIQEALIRAATGREMPWAEAVRTGLRAVNLMRAFNLRGGFDPALETPSPRYGSALPDGDAAGRGIREQWPQIRETYYRELGWDPAGGRPLPDTLRALDLGGVVPDLWPQATSSSR